MVQNLPANAWDTGDMGLILDQEDPLEEEMATHSSILAWRILWTEELGRLQSMVLKRVGHERSNWACRIYLKLNKVYWFPWMAFLWSLKVKGRMWPLGECQGWHVSGIRQPSEKLGKPVVTTTLLLAGGLPSMGSHRVRHDWSDLAAAAVADTEGPSSYYLIIYVMVLNH